MGDWPVTYVGEPSNGVFGFMSFAYLNATLNAKSSWTQCVAATPFDCYLTVAFTGTATYPNADYLFDIGIGAAGAEVVLFPDILRSVINIYDTNSAEYVFIPILIPANTRIAFRTARTTASPTVQCFGYMIPATSWSAFRGFQKMLTHGADSTDSGGTSVTTGSVGSFGIGDIVQIADGSSITSPVKGVIIDIGSQRNTARGNKRYALGVAYGSGYTSVISDYYFSTNSADDLLYPRSSLVIPCSIPAGEAIYLYAGCNTSGAESFDVVLHTLHG